MQNMAEKLASLGLISQKALKLAQAREELAAAERSTTIVDLRSLDGGKMTMDQFNALAEVILVENPSQIEGVLKQANHRFKNSHNPKCKHFIWWWYQIRDRLKILPAEKVEPFLNRALRRHNPTLE